MQAGLDYEDLASIDHVALAEMVDIPLLGAVAAGKPYNAFEVDESLSVPTSLWGGKQVFALRVRGSSMIDEGIHHGDFLIVEPRVAAENGQTVVAEVDGGVTVKKFFREADGSIRLQPANPEMLPLTVRAGSIRIIGIVTGVFRKFAPRRVASQEAEPAPAAPPVVEAKQSEEPTLDLEVNALDNEIERWKAAITHASGDRHLKKHVPQMAELQRDLQALRDWCARTSKAGLRRALLAEANKVIRRMQRFATVTPVQLPDSLLH